MHSCNECIMFGEWEAIYQAAWHKFPGRYNFRLPHDMKYYSNHSIYVHIVQKWKWMTKNQAGSNSTSQGSLFDAKKKSKNQNKNPLTWTYFGDSPIYPFWDPDGQDIKVKI